MELELILIKKKGDKFNKVISHIYENGIDDFLYRNLKNNILKLTTDIYKPIGESEVIFIQPGIPSKDNSQTDLS